MSSENPVSRLSKNPIARLAQIDAAFHQLVELQGKARLAGVKVDDRWWIASDLLLDLKRELNPNATRDTLAEINEHLDDLDSRNG